jgi:hypothetical protein
LNGICAKRAKSLAAYEALIDRLLVSPRHGVNAGGIGRSPTTPARREATGPLSAARWRYRDYVIRAYAQTSRSIFLLEQIAGDEMTDYEKAARSRGRSTTTSLPPVFAMASIYLGQHHWLCPIDSSDRR